MGVYDITYELQDLRYLDWTESRYTSGTPGSLLKSKHVGPGNITYYYKLSSFDTQDGIIGHEAVNELVACRLMNVLGIEHLQYRLVHALVNVHGKEYETWLSKSKNFKEPGEQKCPLDLFYDLNREGPETPYEFCIRMGWKNYLDRMMLVDYLIINRDRHGANIEVLKSPTGGKRLSPIFDNGFSLLAPNIFDKEYMKNFDPNAEIPVNNFVGTRSLLKNMEYIEKPLPLDGLTSDYKKDILCGLGGVIPKWHQEKIWQIIYTRWKKYENLCNKK